MVWCKWPRGDGITRHLEMERHVNILDGGKSSKVAVCA